MAHSIPGQIRQDFSRTPDCARHLYTGRLSRYPTVAEAEAYEYSPREWTIVEHARRRRIAAEQCRQRLEALAREYAVDEIVVVTITETWQTGLRSYELLARAFELTPRS